MNVYYIFGAFALGWFVAQATKLITALIANRGKLTLREMLHWMVKSGGMPSGHTASCVAVVTMIGILDGFHTTTFALAVCLTVIVMYDAVNVRYSVGMQARVLNDLLKKEGGAQLKAETLRVVDGHTVPQVVAGVCVGVAAAFSIAFVFTLI